MNFAAIDVGSNAVRLLLAKIDEDSKSPIYEKVALFRMPMRLGEDAFPHKKISEVKIDKLVKTMLGYKYILDAFEPLDYMACATSAMREAVNGEIITKTIYEKTGLQLDIIHGKKEAEIIYNNHVERLSNGEGCHLYIDVGGGSTEIIIFNDKNIIDSRSFNIGSIRIQEGLVPKSDWDDMKRWIKEMSNKYHPTSAIGSGGNINFIYNMSKIKNGKPITYSRLKKMYTYICDFTIEERISQLGMRPDRADIVVPAVKIYVSIMKWSGISDIFVPQMGLADGIIHTLYNKHKEKYIQYK